MLREVLFDVPAPIVADDLRAAYADKLLRPLPIAALCQIRDSALDLLARQGFLAEVRIPPQDLSSGTVRMEVILGHLVAARVRGRAPNAEGRIAQLLQPLTGKTLNLKSLDRQLILLNEIPGLEATTSLRALENGGAGAIEAVVTVRRRPITGVVSINNWDDSYAAVGFGRIDVNGLIGPLSQTTFGLIRSSDLKGQRGFLAAQQLGIGNFIARARVTRVLTDDPSIGIATKNWFANAQLETLVPANLFGEVKAAIGFDYFNFGVTFQGFKLVEDRLRVAYGRLSWRSSDYALADVQPGLTPKWHASVTVELRKGLSVFGATERCDDFACFADGVPPSRLDANPTATVVRAGAIVDWWLTPSLALHGVAAGQFTTQALLSNEEWVGGNFGIGRGFGANGLRGDQALAGQAELQYGPPSQSGPLGWKAFAFVDAVKVRNLDDLVIAAAEKRAISAGAGIRLRFADRIAVEVLAAYPLAGGPIGLEREPQILGTTAYRF